MIQIGIHNTGDFSFVAIRTFFASGIDILVLNDFIASKEQKGACQ